METFTPAALRWLAGHHGVITTAQLIACGVPRRRIERLVRSGVLTRITNGVFVVAGSPSTLHQRALVLCATFRGGFVTGPTAGMLEGLRRMPTTSRLHFSLPHGVHPVDEVGVRFRQSTKVNAADRRVRPDGIVVASFARLAFDLAQDLDRVDHLSVVNQMLDRRQLTVDELRVVGQRLCHPGRRGTRRFLETMGALGESPQQSHPEVELLDRLQARGVPATAQVPVGAIHLDIGVAEIRWGVEIDIHPAHRQLDGQQADARRRSITNAADWQVEVATELDFDNLSVLVDRLVTNYLRRRGRVLAARG
jgi:hypothetical protein